jgi:hypothetical protein
MFPGCGETRLPFTAGAPKLSGRIEAYHWEGEMSARFVPATATFQELFEEINFSLAALNAHPHGVLHRQPFQDQLTEWKALQVQYYGLLVQSLSARASIIYCDGVLDAIVDGVDAAARKINPDRQSALYQLFFSRQTPSVLKKPILGKQLETLRGWIPILTGSNIPAALVEYGPRLVDAIAAADAAVAAEVAAEKALLQFESIGPKKLFIDALNKLRIKVFAALDNVQLENSEENLPRNFARGFFLQTHGSYSTPTLEEELEEAALRLEEAKRKVAFWEARYAELSTQKAAQDREEEEDRAKRAQLEELERQAAQLRAELKKKK